MCNLFEKFWNWLNDDEPSPTTKTPTCQTTRPNVSQPIKPTQTTQNTKSTSQPVHHSIIYRDFVFESIGDHYSVKEYKGSSPNVVIPNEYLGTPVTSIGLNAFNQCLSIKSIVIPSNIKTINYNAFSYCENLKSVTFEKNSNLTTIGWEAFAGCGLTTITIPSSVTKIEYGAFADCDLDTVIFEDNGQKVTIEDGAFYGCENLVGIALPRNVSLGENVFEDCNTICYAKIPFSAIKKIPFIAIHFLAIIDAGDHDIGFQLAWYHDHDLDDIPISTDIKDIGIVFSFPHYPGALFQGTIKSWLQTCLPNYKDPLLFGPITNPLHDGARLYTNFALVKIVKPSPLL